jgi:hypothetical protein
MSGWGFTTAHVPNYVKGLDAIRTFEGGGLRYILAPRSPAADVLGAAYHFGETPEGATFQSWLTELIPDLDLRAKLFFDLKCLNALNPSQPMMDPVGYDLSAQDSLTTPLAVYLLGLRSSGLCGRVFDLDHHLCPLFTSPCDHFFRGSGRPTLEYPVPAPTYAFHSFFRAIEIKPGLPLENKYTEATHLAGLFNCPVLMEALADSPADYLKQDCANFYGILDGLTALHQAARALSKKALMRLLEILGSEAFTAFDKNGNTFLDALACSQNSGEEAARQIDLLKTFVKFFFATERDLSNREKFYQHLNKFGDTALNIAANRGNKELVTELVFLPGAKTEAKSSTNPKGIDFGALGIDYGTLLARKHAIFGEYMMTLEESVFSLREEGELQREAMRAMAIELEESRQNQFFLMQTMVMLCRDLSQHRGLLRPETAALLSRTPFLALGDLAEAGAGAGAGVDGEADPG